MKQRSILALLLTFALILSSFPLYAFADEADVSNPKSEIPYCDHISGVSVYDVGTTLTMMTADEADQANVPEGYSGHVMKLTHNSSGIGLNVDPALISGEEVKQAYVDSIVVRAYIVGTNVKEIRATVDGGTTWLKQENPSATDTWIEYSIPVTMSMAYEDGETLSPFCLVFRFTNNTLETTVYIDSITLKYKDPADVVDISVAKEEIPYCAKAGDLTGYGGTQTLMNPKLAAEAGVPEGYDGYVMSIVNPSVGNYSLCFDLRQSVCKGVKIEDVESITFRVWANSAVSSLRIKTIENGNWQINIPTPALGEWIDFEVTDTSVFVDDGEGYFSPFVFAFRASSGAANVYVDSVTVKLKQVETETTAKPETTAETETTVETETTAETETTVASEIPEETETINVEAFKEEIPYGEFGDSYKPYTYTGLTMLDEKSAPAAGVPEGYTGYVMKLEGAASGMGIGLDLHKYKTNDIESITFRVWCPAETKSDGVRLTNTDTNTWIMLADPGATGAWVEVVLSKESNFNTSTKDFSVMDDGNGYVKDMNFCFRYNASSAVAYIDSITVKLRDPDTVPPVVTYDGETTINTTAGKIFTLDGASAFDAYDNASVQPEYIYSEGAVDENGLLLEGEHTCTVRFTDAAGNSSEINLTLKVEAKDVIAPTLNWTVDKLFANVGMRFMIDITATDDRDGEVEVVMTWSEGALDSRGRFNEGEHTLTITAVDKTGNKTEKVISVIVTSGLPTV